MEHPYDAWSLRAGLLLSELPPRLDVTRGWVENQARRTASLMHEHRRFPQQPDANLNALRDHRAHLLAHLDAPAPVAIRPYSEVRTPNLLSRIRQGRIQKRTSARHAHLIPAAMMQTPKAAQAFLERVASQAARPLRASLPGQIDSHGIYREVQGSSTNLCGLHVLNSVLHGRGRIPISADHFTQQILGGMVSHYLDGHTSLETLNANLGDLGASYHPVHGLRIDPARSDIQTASPNDLTEVAKRHGLHSQHFSVIARGEGVRPLTRFAQADLSNAHSIMVLRSGHWVGLTKGRDNLWHEIDSIPHAGRPHARYSGSAHAAFQAFARDRNINPQSILAF